MRKLTDRLAAVAALIPCGTSMADIGTDHAYLPLFLVQSGKMKRAVASDIHQGPLERAREHIASEGGGHQISLRLGPGLAPLQTGEVEGASICGMGGLMIRDILAADAEKARAMRWLVLQPQNHVAELKQYMCAEGWTIDAERLVLDDGQLYELFRIVPGMPTTISLLDAEIGVTPAYRKDPLFPQHLQRLIHKRDILIDHTPPEAENDRTRRKRERAVKEKAVLELVAQGM